LLLIARGTVVLISFSGVETSIISTSSFFTFIKDIMLFADFGIYWIVFLKAIESLASSFYERGGSSLSLSSESMLIRSISSADSWSFISNGFGDLSG
jgi:hypothetical protein